MRISLSGLAELLTLEVICKVAITEHAEKTRHIAKTGCVVSQENVPHVRGNVSHMARMCLDSFDVPHIIFYVGPPSCRSSSDVQIPEL